MSKETVDLTIYLDKDLASEIKKKTKLQLIEGLVPIILKSRVQTETIDSLEKEIKMLQAKLTKTEAHIEQGRAMINSVMSRWYDEYTVGTFAKAYIPD